MMIIAIKPCKSCGEVFYFWDGEEHLAKFSYVFRL